jgi:hypothetical protein
VASVLSLGSNASLPEGDPYTRAVACAAAVEVISRMLTEMGAGAGATEMDALHQARDLYRERAAAAADDGRGNASEAAAAIAAKLAVAEKNPSTQGQVAIACLRQIQPAA